MGKNRIEILRLLHEAEIWIEKIYLLDSKNFITTSLTPNIFQSINMRTIKVPSSNAYILYLRRPPEQKSQINFYTRLCIKTMENFIYKPSYMLLMCYASVWRSFVMGSPDHLCIIKFKKLFGHGSV